MQVETNTDCYNDMVILIFTCTWKKMVESCLFVLLGLQLFWNNDTYIMKKNALGIDLDQEAGVIRG